jgi:hypothetical protein
MISNEREEDPSPVSVPENDPRSRNGVVGVEAEGSVIRSAPPFTPAIVRLNGFGI